MELNFSNLTISNVWSGFGLIMDIIGVLFLGWAFFSKSFRDIKKESGTYLGYNPPLFYNLLDQKASGIVGTVALFVGFVQQFIVNVPINSSISLINLIILLSCANIIVLISLLIFKHYYVLFCLGKIKIIWDENLKNQHHSFIDTVNLGKKYSKEIRGRIPPDEELTR
jgi:hypothetical protein